MHCRSMPGLPVAGGSPPLARGAGGRAAPGGSLRVDDYTVDSNRDASDAVRDDVSTHLDLTRSDVCSDCAC